MSRKIFKNSLIFILVLAGLLLIRYSFAQDFGTNEVGGGLDGSLAEGDPRTIIGRIINIALGFLGVIALGLIIYAGYLWMTSAGNEEKVAAAKKTLISATIGLAIILASWAIATFVINQLSEATSGNNNSGICTDGAVTSCQCGGAMYCSNGAWGECIGSNCGPGGPGGPTSCDSSPNPGCQANNNICVPGYYCDDGCTCQPQGSIGDSCDANPENETCSASDDLCGEFLLCDSDTCTCSGPPVISGISPAGGFCEEDINKSCQSDSDCSSNCDKETPNGATGNLVTIFGNNFGEYEEGFSEVVFNNNIRGRSPVEVNGACFNFWSDKQIVIALPEGISDGPVRVIRSDNSSDSTDNEYGPYLSDFVANNINRPGLCLVSPESAMLGDEISYQGVNLYSGKAYFGNYINNVQALDSNFTHPSGLSGQAKMSNIGSGESDSFIISQIGGNQEASNFVRISKEADPNEGPYIVSFFPEEGRVGQYVTISGSGFGNFKGSSRVYFGSSEADYDFPSVCASSVWSDNRVIVKVPENIENGNYFVRLDINEQTIDSSELNPNTFSINNNLSLSPSLCKLEPETGTVATPVKLYGEYFGNSGQEAIVKFYNNKNISGTVERENDADKVSVSVPEGSISGPVTVVKNNQEGNKLNYTVAACTSNENCPGQVCCPANTYKNGRCVEALTDCLIDIPTSVFEWNFSTAYTLAEITDPTESCNSLANYYGACQTGTSCPNASGVCSPYSGGSKQIIGECDYSCASVEGCGGGLGSSTCSYDENLNKCIKNGSDGLCSLNQSQTFTIAEIEYNLSLACNIDGNWQTVTETSCPDNWERGLNNVCVDKNSVCDVCDSGLDCQKIGSEGRCVSNSICPAGSECEESADVDSPGNCIALDDASCDCCCRIGNSAQDCCAPLECGGTCGSDVSDDGIGFGVCSGCAAVGNTQAEQDAACNCSITSGQFCSVANENPQGICTDCSSLKDKESCDLHSGVCCFDDRQKVCRGGSGEEISDNPEHPNYGYCAYYNCDNDDSLLCASSYPVKIGSFKNVYDCEEGCSQGEGDICSLFDGNKDECTQVSSCCFDFSTNECQGGEQITDEENSGYCAYYDCGDINSDPPGNPNSCVAEAKTTGTFSSYQSCSASCGNTDGGSGQLCVSDAISSVCDFDVCNYPGMACLTEGGNGASDVSDCGACCCSPANPNACQTEAGPDLYCQPNVGNCSGDNRGLCCGCEQDGECGNENTIGCGIDSCCQARPNVTESVPASGSDNICRNAVVKISFDQIMDLGSLDNNVLLLQEMDYGSGVCPTGTFVYQQDGIKDRNALSRVFNNIKVTVSNFFSKTFLGNKQVFADLPDPNKLYCASAVSVLAENTDKKTDINILPKKLLAPSTNYFVVIKGDEELNSQAGVMAVTSIGLNGEGLELETGTVEGENIKFNNTTYINSHIVQFKTLSDSEQNSGVCSIDSVSTRPSSYLFRTTDNSLNENDASSQDKTFDTESDRDKVFSAWAYSADGQAIQPVTGYFWDWDFRIINTDIAAIKPVTDLAPNRVLVEADIDITDGETVLLATVDMERFLGESANSNPSCVCTDNSCSSSCLNAFSEGDNSSSSSEIYVFICNNPWPPIEDGNWSPWTDNCEDVVGGSCTDFNYKFYYCRDAGEPGTFDDLPAISNKAVIRGESTVLACSSDNTPCTNYNTSCGEDRNGDGEPDGICIWNVLKESYFFREQVLAPGEITNAINTNVGQEVLLSWKSSSEEVAGYKIYYGEEGRAISSSREVSRSDADCQLAGEEYTCQMRISNLENNKTYAFRLSVISENDTESILSNTRTATPTDQTAPLVPTNLNFEDIKEEVAVRFSWTGSDNNVLFYRLYRGINSGLYGESFDSNDKITSISLSKSSLTDGMNYFAVSALDAYENESEKSSEKSFAYSVKPTGLKFVEDLEEDLLVVSWDKNSNYASNYYLLLGTRSGVYEDSFELNGSDTSFIFNRNDLYDGDNYFAVMAVSESGIESEMSSEIRYNK